jgi:YgiT-type zinc finger domain-containing protein
MGSVRGKRPRSEPDSGNPTVRDRRGAFGNVTRRTGLRAASKGVGNLLSSLYRARTEDLSRSTALGWRYLPKPPSSWPIGVPLRDPVHQPRRHDDILKRQARSRAWRRSFLLPNFLEESSMRTPMSNEGFSVSVCPTCGSSAIRKVSGSWSGNYKGETYTVKALEYYACPNCNEKVYPPEAMRRIQHASPAYRKSAARRAARRAPSPGPQADA